MTALIWEIAGIWAIAIVLTLILILLHRRLP